MPIILTFAPMVEGTPAPPDAPPVCDEVGYVTRNRVSAYQRTRVHLSRLVRGETRCLIADFNGAISASRSIVSGLWQCDQYNAVVMSNAQGDARTASVLIATPNSGGARLKCTVTLDNGEVYNAAFLVMVRGAPWFQGETGISGSGPSSLAFTV